MNIFRNTIIFFKKIALFFSNQVTFNQNFTFS